MSVRRLLPFAAVLAVLLAGCADDSDTSTSATTATAPTPTPTSTTTTTTTTPRTEPKQKEPRFDASKVRSDGKITTADRRLISRAIDRITRECVQRRMSKKKVARPTAQFREAVDVLIAQFKDTPDVRFTRTGQSRKTTMQATLARLGNTLAVPAPEGCGSNSFQNGGTISVRTRIRAALQSR